MAPTQALDTDKLRTTFKESQAQEQEAGEGEQPHRHRMLAGESSADDANGEQKCEDEHVDERPFLEVKGICAGKSGVENQRGGGGFRNAKCNDDSQNQ